jgi:hypothetical protein
MLWGQYPALVDGPLDSYVDGMTCVIETKQHLQMLEEYETKAYCLSGIRIEVDGKIVSGSTFIWAKDDLSALTEGTWSLEEWMTVSRAMLLITFTMKPNANVPLGFGGGDGGGVVEVEGTYTLSLTFFSEYLDIYVLSSFLCIRVSNCVNK